MEKRNGPIYPAEAPGVTEASKDVPVVPRSQQKAAAGVTLANTMWRKHAQLSLANPQNHGEIVKFFSLSHYF